MRDMRLPKSRYGVVALHALANNSDPYAAKRISHYLDKGYDTQEAVAADAARVVADRKRRKAT